MRLNVARRLTAKVENSEQCPIFELSDRMTFDLPEVVPEESAGVCAIAIADLLPSILRLAAGGKKPRQSLACRGCLQGRAQAQFSISVEVSEIGEQTRAVLIPILSSIPLFKNLTERRLEKVLTLVSVNNFEQGQILIEVGAVNQPLYIVVNGEVEILTPNDNKLGRIGILGSGECIGEMSLLTGDPTSATIRCITDVRALSITKADFDRLLAETPSLNTYFSKLLADRLKKTSSKLLDDLKSDHDISGDLTMFSCPEIIQAISSTNRTGVLTIEQPNSTVALSFNQGRVVDIDTPMDPPQEAIFNALTWKQGTFNFQVKDPSEINQTVALDTMSLLLEGMRRQDEFVDTDPLDGFE
jgi:CRP/FNR family transcriptional regulator, cyclic AMP receptor protein